ncbi:hypothetical protein NMY22_g10906 [Coprinellus aureogranulatus]|nr:hypothetical protein NMY22_g10906 [Coprinellus aureogranulatus]
MHARRATGDHLCKVIGNAPQYQAFYSLYLVVKPLEYPYTHSPTTSSRTAPPLRKHCVVFRPPVTGLFVGKRCRSTTARGWTLETYAAERGSKIAAPARTYPAEPSSGIQPRVLRRLLVSTFCSSLKDDWWGHYLLWRFGIFVAPAAVQLVSAQFRTLRFPCSQLVTERFDPLVTPGQVSPHLHQVVGGNAFNITMDSNDDYSSIATCTTCRFKEDNSNYWTMVMYFKHRNGSFIRVPQIANENTGAPDGGMTIYYIEPRSPSKNVTITTFPKGFRMRVGNPMNRRNEVRMDEAAVNQTTIRCWDGTGIGPGTPGTGPLDTRGFPAAPCRGGIRSQVYFPQCWDGVNLDSADHQSHVAHPVGRPTPDGNLFFGTDCPASHPFRLPFLFMETVWDTKPFNDPELWPTDGTQPLVWSMGDPTGYGHHADYIFGWDGDALHRAMSDEGCMTSYPGICEVLTRRSDEEMAKCRIAPRVAEVTEGQYIERLPGCNPIQSGPEPATVITNCDAVSTTIGTPSPTSA